MAVLPQLPKEESFEEFRCLDLPPKMGKKDNSALKSIS